MDERVARRVTLSGMVQGVGFRPFVYNLAQRWGLGGWVLNHSGGVDVEVEGPASSIDAFIVALHTQAPPLAQIEALEVEVVSPSGYTAFEIRHSQTVGGQYLLISPDVATCSNCVRELFDPADRRYRYPFINCTSCGPRFTIIDEIPYDRPNTTMRAFPLCPACRAEYEDPGNRRFHAQPNACPVCGPHIWLTDSAGRPLAAGPKSADTEAVLAQARDLLLSGSILALKGLGGFHLACDATNPQAVQALRERKRRPHKPFAVMVATLAEAQALCEVDEAAEALLSSPPCPIVLLTCRGDDHIAASVAPHSRTLGLMLPYTPLHHLLLHDVGRPLVMTSGNLSEEPIAVDNAEALQRLASLADAFLLHDRDIHARYDDSVWHVVPSVPSQDGSASLPQPVRRARSYAPSPIALPFALPQIFAAGPALKATFTLTRDRYAFVSQHMGDLETLETLEHYTAALATYQHLFRLDPAYVACDLHPDYLSTRFAQHYAREHGLPAPYAVQHHEAHIAACLADNGWALDAGPVIGVAFDGTGYGRDGAIWGGEWFVGGYEGFRRAAQLEYLPLPGGDAAIHHPWRTAVAYLHALLGAEAMPAGVFCPSEAFLIHQQVERGLNTPLTSSAGRLFDAVSALLQVCQTASYEAQAAIELEQLATTVNATPGSSYPFDVDTSAEIWQLRLGPLFEALLSDVQHELPAAEIAWRFHRSVASMIAATCNRLREATGLATVVLSGGVFQNRLLLQMVVPALAEAGLRVLLHRSVPTNDGGVSLGQAVLARFALSRSGAFTE